MRLTLSLIVAILTTTMPVTAQQKMSAYVIIETATKKIVNRVEYERPPPTPIPGFGPGFVAVQHNTADTTWTWDGASLKPPPARVPTAREIQVLAAANASSLDARIATGSEELIAALVAKGVIRKDDLSPDLAKAIDDRRSLRGQPPL